MDDNAVRPPAQKRFFRIHQHRAVHQRHHVRIGRGVAIGGGTLHVQHEAVFLQILLDSADFLFALAVFADLPRVAPVAADLAARGQHRVNRHELRQGAHVHVRRRADDDQLHPLRAQTPQLRQPILIKARQVFIAEERAGDIEHFVRRTPLQKRQRGGFRPRRPRRPQLPVQERPRGFDQLPARRNPLADAVQQEGEDGIAAGKGIVKIKKRNALCHSGQSSCSTRWVYAR